MKRVFRQWLAGLLSVVIILTLLPAAALAAEGFPGSLEGNGESEETPYLIENAEQLRQLSTYVNGGQDFQNTYFKLTADINLGGSADNPWTPIGANNTYFYGTFDGNNHTVSGLYIDNSSNNYSYVGLFGYIGSSGIVKNLGVSGTIIGKGNDDVGGIAGDSYGAITGCHSACTIQNGNYSGGIVGRNYGKVEDCYNLGEISNGHYAGGIVGENRDTVKDCYNAGTVSNGHYAGGIVGKTTATLACQAATMLVLLQAQPQGRLQE